MDLINVKVFTKYTASGPSSRCRYCNYVECFKKRSIEVCINHYFTLNYLASSRFFVKLFIGLEVYSIRFISVYKLKLFPNIYQLKIRVVSGPVYRYLSTFVFGMTNLNLLESRCRLLFPDVVSFKSTTQAGIIVIFLKNRNAGSKRWLIPKNLLNNFNI